MRILSSFLATATPALALLCAGTTATAQGNAISNPYLTGVWKEDQQCRGNEAMVFFANGTMSSAGSTPVNYSVTGPTQIIMYGPGGSAPFGAQYVNQNKMIITINNDASVLYRCASAATAQLSSSFIVGGWSTNGNCARPEVFSAGGQMRSSQGDAGTWALFGNTLRLTGVNGNAVDFAVQVNGPRNMTLTQLNPLNQGSNPISNYSRCF